MDRRPSTAGSRGRSTPQRDNRRCRYSRTRSVPPRSTPPRDSLLHRSTRPRYRCHHNNAGIRRTHRRLDSYRWSTRGSWDRSSSRPRSPQKSGSTPGSYLDCSTRRRHSRHRCSTPRSRRRCRSSGRRWRTVRPLCRSTCLRTGVSPDRSTPRRRSQPPRSSTARRNPLHSTPPRDSGCRCSIRPTCRRCRNSAPRRGIRHPGYTDSSRNRIGVSLDHNTRRPGSRRWCNSRRECSTVGRHWALRWSGPHRRPTPSRIAICKLATTAPRRCRRVTIRRASDVPLPLCSGPRTPDSKERATQNTCGKPLLSFIQKRGPRVHNPFGL